MGCAYPEGATGANIARQIALRAGLPVTVAGHDRQPLLLLGPADHRHGGAAHHRRRGRGVRRRRRGVHLLRAERDQHAHARRGLAQARTSPRSTGRCCRPPRRWPSATASRASAGRVRRRKPAARRGRARRRASSTTRSCRSPSRPAWPTRRSGLRTQAKSPSAPTKASAPTPPTKACRRSARRVPGGVIAAGNASQFSDGAGACVVMSEQLRRAQRPEAAGHLPRLRRRRLRARRDGHRPGVRGAQAAQARWA